ICERPDRRAAADSAAGFQTVAPRLSRETCAAIADACRGFRLARLLAVIGNRRRPDNHEGGSSQWGERNASRTAHRVASPDSYNGAENAYSTSTVGMTSARSSCWFSGTSALAETKPVSAKRHRKPTEASYC